MCRCTTAAVRSMLTRASFADCLPGAMDMLDERLAVLLDDSPIICSTMADNFPDGEACAKSHRHVTAPNRHIAASGRVPYQEAADDLGFSRPRPLSRLTRPPHLPGAGR